MSQRGLRVEFTMPRPRQKRPETDTAPKDPVPCIARLLALAHKWEGMVRRDEVKDYAEIARLMGLSRARVTQICNLVLLSPDLQERLLTRADAECAPSPRRVRRASLRPLWCQQSLSP